MEFKMIWPDPVDTEGLQGDLTLDCEPLFLEI